jgi:hypothetical protein
MPSISLVRGTHAALRGYILLSSTIHEQVSAALSVISFNLYMKFCCM